MSNLSPQIHLDRNAKYIQRLSERSKMQRDMQLQLQKTQALIFKTNITGANEKDTKKPIISKSTQQILPPTQVMKQSSTEEQFMGSLLPGGQVNVHPIKQEVLRDIDPYPTNVRGEQIQKEELQPVNIPIEIPDDIPSEPSADRGDPEPYNFAETGETFGDTNETQGLQEEAEGPRLIQGTDFFIPESLLMMVDAMDQFQANLSIKKQMDQSSSQKTQFVMTDDQGNMIQSGSEAQASIKPANVVDLLAFQAKLPKTLFRDDSIDGNVDDQIDLHPDQPVEPGRISRENRVMNLMNSLTSEGVDPEELAHKILEMGDAKKEQLLQALQNVEHGHNSYVKELVKLADTKKVLPKLAQPPRRLPSAKSNPFGKAQLLNPKMPKILQNQVSKSNKLFTKAEDQPDFGIQLTPLIQQSPAVNRQYVQSKILVFEFVDTFAIQDAIGVQLPLILADGKQVQYYALYFSRADQFKVSLITNRQTTLDCIVGNHKLYAVPLAYNEFTQFSIQQVIAKPRSQLGTVNHVNVKLFSVSHVAGEDQKTVFQKFIFEGLYQNESQLLMEQTLILCAVMNPGAADVKIMLQHSKNTHQLYQNQMTTNKETKKITTLKLPKTPQIIKTMRDIITITILSNYGCQDHTELGALTLYDQRGLPVNLDPSFYTVTGQHEYIEALWHASEDPLSVGILPVQIKVSVDQNSISAVKIENSASEQACAQNISVTFNQRPPQVFKLRLLQTQIVVVNTTDLDEDRLLQVIEGKALSPKANQMHPLIVSETAELTLQLLEPYDGGHEFELFNVFAVDSDGFDHSVKFIKISADGDIFVNEKLVEPEALVEAAQLPPLLRINQRSRTPVIVRLTFQNDGQFTLSHLVICQVSSSSQIKSVFVYLNGTPIVKQPAALKPAPPRDWADFVHCQLSGLLVYPEEHQQIVRVGQASTAIQTALLQNPRLDIAGYVAQSYFNQFRRSQNLQAHGTGAVYLVPARCVGSSVQVTVLSSYKKTFGFKSLSAMNVLREAINGKVTPQKFYIQNQDIITFEHNGGLTTNQENIEKVLFQVQLEFDEVEVCGVNIENSGSKRIQIAIDSRIVFEGVLEDKDDKQWVSLTAGQRGKVLVE